jgi:molybdopterin biosynthesis enzyme MoaB
LIETNHAVSEIENLKNECYNKIDIIKSRGQSRDSSNGQQESIEDERSRIKESIASVLAEISDVSLYIGG